MVHVIFEAHAHGHAQEDAGIVRAQRSVNLIRSVPTPESRYGRK